jgi:uncharacterized protein
MKNIQVKDGKNGFGMYATAKIKPGQLITAIEGNLVHWKVLLKLNGVIQDNAIRYDDDYYISPSGAGNYINHSCNPNSGLVKKGKKLLLVTIAGVNPGHEICFDYSTITGDDDIWTMKCNCRTVDCRKVIKNFGALPNGIRQKYIACGIVPKYILDTTNS